MQEAENPENGLDSYIVVKNNFLTDQNVLNIQDLYQDTAEHDIILLSACHWKDKRNNLVDNRTQTNTKGFFCSSPFFSYCDDKAPFNGCMDHDVVLLPAQSRVNRQGFLLIDAWTQTISQGFLYCSPSIMDDEISDDDTLFDGWNKETKANGSDDPDDSYNLISLAKQKIVRLIWGVYHYIPRSNINYILNLCKIGCVVGLRYSYDLFSRFGFVFF